MPADESHPAPAEPASGPPPTDGPPDVPLSLDFTDLRRVLAEAGMITPGPPYAPHGHLWIDEGHGSGRRILVRDCASDPITPDEATEELDDREAEELAVIEDIENEADRRPGAARTWAELDACVEAERRFELDYIATTSKIFADHIRRIEGDEATGSEWKLAGVDTLPPGVKAEFLRFLRELAKTAGKLAGKHGSDQ